MRSYLVVECSWCGAIKTAHDTQGDTFNLGEAVKDAIDSRDIARTRWSIKPIETTGCRCPEKPKVEAVAKGEAAV